MRLALTERDLLLLRALTYSVRYMTLSQVQRCYWPASRGASTAPEMRLKRLVEHGWIGRARVLARPLPEIAQPIRVWYPGDKIPQLESDAWKAKSRWRQAPRMTPIYFAEGKATQAFRGTRPRRVRQRFQITHDIGVAEVYAHYFMERPAEVLSWIGEIAIPPFKYSRKCPDAVLGSAAPWKPYRIIEFAGCYDLVRIKKFHQFCIDVSLPYELW